MASIHAAFSEAAGGYEMMMSLPYHELEARMNALLSAATRVAPDMDFLEAKNYLDHNEFELALDTIAATLAAAGKRVDSTLYLEFVRLGHELEFDEGNWAAIRPA